MKRRGFLKIVGGLLSLPVAAKLMKGKSFLKPAAKTVAKTLPKVQGMPEWFTPLVNKIMKEGTDISPKASRVEDMTTVKKLEIPSETGKPDTITLTQNKITGEISIESDVAGSVDNSPFELNYRPPKSDINLETGKEIKYPGDFSVIENRPRPTSEPGDYEFDYENLRVEDAYSDLERLEKIATGKIKDAKKIEERAAGRKMLEESPYEDIINRYPDPDIGDYDYANGGLASFANGGILKPGKAISKIGGPTQKEIDDFVNQPIPMGQGIPVNEFLPGEDYTAYVRRKRRETGPLLFAGEPVTMPVLPSTSTPQINVNTNPIARSLEMAGFTKEEIMKIIGERGYASGGLTKTVPPAMGPDSQGVETLFRRRYS
jgi:hypothetical protein